MPVRIGVTTVNYALTLARVKSVVTVVATAATATWGPSLAITTVTALKGPDPCNSQGQANVFYSGLGLLVADGRPGRSRVRVLRPGDRTGPPLLHRALRGGVYPQRPHGGLTPRFISVSGIQAPGPKLGR